MLEHVGAVLASLNKKQHGLAMGFPLKKPEVNHRDKQVSCCVKSTKESDSPKRICHRRRSCSDGALRKELPLFLRYFPPHTMSEMRNFSLCCEKISKRCLSARQISVRRETSFYDFSLRRGVEAGLWRKQMALFLMKFKMKCALQKNCWTNRTLAKGALLTSDQWLE